MTASHSTENIFDKLNSALIDQYGVRAPLTKYHELRSHKTWAFYHAR